MKTQPRQHISNKYNTCTVVTSPVYIRSKIICIIVSSQGQGETNPDLSGAALCPAALKI